MFFSQRGRTGIYLVNIHHLFYYLHISLSGIMGRWMPENARWTRLHFAGSGLRHHRNTDKALGSTFARGHCSVSTEAMASVAFNMSARAAVGGAQLKLSAQRKRGACPASSLHRPSPGAPRTRNLAEGLGLFSTAGFHAMPFTGANAAATSTRPACGALGRIHRFHVMHHARVVDGSSEASRRRRASRRESRRRISRLYPLPPGPFIQSSSHRTRR